MSNTFIYEQGWLVEKPEMDKPKKDLLPNYRVTYDTVMAEYEKHLSDLRRFKYDYPDPGKEMEFGKDFEVIEDQVQDKYDDGNWARSFTIQEVAIPITLLKTNKMSILSGIDKVEYKDVRKPKYNLLDKVYYIGNKRVGNNRIIRISYADVNTGQPPFWYKFENEEKDIEVGELWVYATKEDLIKSL